MAEQLNEDQSNIAQVVEEYTGLELTDDEVETIRSAEKPNEAINNVVSDRALVGGTSSVHTGVDVPIYAYGPASDDFSGLVENTDLPKIMAEAMGVKLGSSTEDEQSKDKGKNKDKHIYWEDQGGLTYATPLMGWDKRTLVDYLKSNG
ncbi:hypothetical protein GCM10010954_10380 [Halobacillus andaensis]|uniref:Alkaline phosphatase n=1 Tax=Halobacillus andaensis TaxID=1176239 RepID=A0A917EW28_HALAA|nr:alkaline phosphatase [Halobacillus andaensis]MBP2003829.1 hypothetical protein [Halobacillus andaensis]GGF13579.1 hypothetical protein GCM10010954_10380 [Halobacillus andaensis]